MLVGQFRLAPAKGAQFVAAVREQQAADCPQPVDSAEAEAVPVSTAGAEVRLVDALLQLVQGSGPDTSPEGLVASSHPEVVLHVSAGDLGSERPGRRHLEDGPAVGPGAAQRLACDSIVTALLHDPRGRVIDVGRRHRLVTPRLRRAVAERDGGICTFPGCRNNRWLDVHHVVHWEDGGPTDLGNLLLLCGTHHRAHHDGAFDVTMVQGEPVFELFDQIPIVPAPALRAVPPPPDDLLRVSDVDLGPIEGDWNGDPIDPRWIIDGFVLRAERRARELA